MSRFRIRIGAAVLVTALFLSATVSAQPPEHAPHAGHGSHPHAPGDANAHMHQSPVEDLIARFESPERDAYQHPDKVLDWLGKLEGKTVADIGAGSGYFSVKLARRGAKVIAADVDDGFLEHLRRRVANEALRNVEVRKVPYASPGLAAGEADVVFLVNTYHHIENRAEYFAHVRTGLAKDGRLVVVDYFKTDVPVGPPPAHKLAIDEIVAELKQAGFTRFEVNVDLLPYQFLIRAW